MTTSAGVARGHLSRCFIAAILLYIIIFAMSRSRKSWWDALAARKVAFTLKTTITVELFVLLPLIYCVISLGSPVPITSKDLNYHWIYGYGRPVAGILLLCFGIFGDMHAVARWICTCGAIIQAAGDAYSAVQVYDYMDQVQEKNAPNGDYSIRTLLWYYWRDVGSFGLCVLLLLVCLHLSTIVGWCQPQLISYPTIVGGEVDRTTVFQEQRAARRMFDFRNYLTRKEEKMLRKENRRERRERVQEQQRARAVHLGYMEKGTIKSLSCDRSDDDDEEKSVDNSFNIVNRATEIAL